MEKTLIFFTLVGSAFGITTNYSSYYGLPLTSSQVAEYQANNTISNCTVPVETCNAAEGRRIDGTCNNLDSPSYGATRTPYIRTLPASFHRKSKSEWNPRLSKDNSSLPLAREMRTAIWAEGRIEDRELTSGITHMAVFFATDITNTQDTTNYLSWRPYCCKSAGKKDYACAPNKVPTDDFVHRFSKIKCLNMTRPLTFQTSGCLPNTTTPLRLVDATPTQDMSPVYGNVIEKGRRNYTGGLLNVETVNNRTYPPASGVKILLGVNFVGIIYFWRFHNHIASKISALNPCWTDDQIFNTTREINIAFGAQMYYYELMGILMGTDNLVNDGVLSSSSGFRENYNASVLPQMALEFPYILRWMHSMQDGELKLISENDTVTEVYPITNLTSNVNYLKSGKNMDYVAQSCFRQPAANSKDWIADPDIVERGLGILQKSNDIMTNDLAKGRYYGFPGYTSYLAHCFGENITSFDELSKYIDVERITILKEKYKYVEDIDLLAGTWAERPMNGSHVPPTFYCLVADQLKRTTASDRHWFESETRPNAFTAAQLAEVRKASMARLLCDIGGGVTEIQPKAFLLPSEDNVITSCSNIPDLDYTAWEDSTCTSTS